MPCVHAHLPLPEGLWLLMLGAAKQMRVLVVTDLTNQFDKLSYLAGPGCG